MKLYRNLVAAVADLLQKIFVEKKYADKEIEKVLKSNPKWGARDRAFIAENTYEIVRWWRLMLFLANETEIRNEASFFWKIIGIWFLYQKQSLPDWQEWQNLETNWQDHLEEAQKVRKIWQSVPDWLDQRAEAEIGENWTNQLQALNQTAKVVIRTNSLKINVLDLKKQLAQENIFTQQLAQMPDALVLEKRLNIFSSSHFKNGFFEIQDASSQLVAPFLDAQAGMRIVDACAGAGGKSLHLAALTQNKGKIIALDTESWKLDELKKRAKRLGISNIETRSIENAKTIKRLYDSADRLLLDVPCSGLGVLRRNPDAKWKIQPDFLEKIQETQRQILENYSKILKKDGKMLYATCSILPSENEAQVAWFLSKNPDFELLKEQKVSPTEGFDGFYMALLQKK